MAGIAAGIVTYNPPLERLRENIGHIVDQVEKLYLIDNGSDNLEEIQSACAKDARIEIIPLGKNLGIAAALNRMLQQGEADAFDWVLTLDQDSVCAADLIAQYTPYLGWGNLALICPYVEYIGTGEERPADMPPYTYVHRCITSASLTNVAIWRAVGGFDERLFIDMVDYDYCALVREKGYKILQVNGALLHQELGAKARRVTLFNKLGKLPGLGRWRDARVYVYNHSPQRTYYYARNSRYYLWRYKDILDPTEAKGIKRWLQYKLLFEGQRFSKFRAILRGRRDGKKLIQEGKAKQNG